MSWAQTLFLKKVIDGKKTFVGSDNPLIAFFDSNNSKLITKNSVLGTFIPNINGNVLLYGIGSSTVSSSNTSYIDVFENEKLKTSIGFRGVEDSNHTIDLKVQKGKTYVFKVGDNRDLKLKSFKLQAQIVEVKAYDHTIGDE